MVLPLPVKQGEDWERQRIGGLWLVLIVLLVLAITLD